MILYREKTQIRFCINITDTDKREKMLHFEICYRDMPFCYDIKRTFRLKNVLLHDHSKRYIFNYNCCR